MSFEFHTHLWKSCLFIVICLPSQAGKVGKSYISRERERQRERETFYVEALTILNFKLIGLGSRTQSDPTPPPQRRDRSVSCISTPKFHHRSSAPASPGNRPKYPEPPFALFQRESGQCCMARHAFAHLKIAWSACEKGKRCCECSADI